MLSVIGYQLSVISYLLTVICYQLCEIIRTNVLKTRKEMNTEEKSVWNKICCIFDKLKLLIMTAVLNIFKKSKKATSTVKTTEVRSALVRLVNRIDTTDGKSKVVKIGDKYFRVRELG